MTLTDLRLPADNPLVGEPLDFVSLFTGIGGFDLAMESLGMVCKGQVEIDKACQLVLKQRLPHVKTLIGDIRDAGRHNLPSTDIVCGGSPCQDLSVAGNRKGLAGERSGLWYEFHRVCTELKPRYVFWENVPGVLSSGSPDSTGKPRKGTDFAIILSGLTGLIPTIPDGGWRKSGFMRGRAGFWSVAWRVLDAQYFGLAQRRERLFLIGYLGDGRAAHILFEQGIGSLPHPPRRGTGQSTAAFAAKRVDLPSRVDESAAVTIRGRSDGFSIDSQHELAYNLLNPGEGGRKQNNLVTYSIKGAAIGREPQNGPQHGEILDDDSMYTLNTTETHAVATVVYDPTQITSPTNESNPKDGDPCHTLAAGAQPPLMVQEFEESPAAHTFIRQRSDEYKDDDLASAIRARDYKEASDLVVYTDSLARIDRFEENEDSIRAVQKGASASTAQEHVYHKPNGVSDAVYAARPPKAIVRYGVRKLTPTECERLQGFPEGWTLVDSGKKKRRKIAADLRWYYIRQFEAAYGRTPTNSEIMRLASDTQRYKQLGNSVAVDVILWIASRIIEVERVYRAAQPV